MMYTLLTDTEATFLGFSNACASAGEGDCKLLTLLHKNATGEEIKRFVEDSHDVCDQVGFRLRSLTRHCSAVGRQGLVRKAR